MNSATSSRQAEILARSIRATAAILSQEAARYMLTLQITNSDRDRVNELAAMARQDVLTAAERSELDDYEWVASLLELMQSMARSSNKRAGLAP
jgi:hypothetical protein